MQQWHLGLLRLPHVVQFNNEQQSWLVVMETEN